MWEQAPLKMQSVKEVAETARGNSDTIGAGTMHVMDWVAHCHTVKVFHSKDMSFWTIFLHYKYFSESTDKLTNH
jgi:hypothetical protein